MRSFYSLGGINPEVDCARRVGALSCLSDADFDVLSCADLLRNQVSRPSYDLALWLPCTFFR